MVATCDESGPCGRAKGSSVKVGVSQSGLGDAVERWRGNRTAERTRCPVTNVIGQNELLIFPSMSAIFACVRLRISALVVRWDIRNANSSRISLSEKPSS